MISDDELSELPDDPELAFVELESILRHRLEGRVREAHEEQYDPDLYRLEYMNKVAAAAYAFKIEALRSLSVPRDADARLDIDLQRFTRDVDFVTMQIRIQRARANREGSVELDDIAKAKLRHFITQIRDIIDKANLPEDKRDALLNKLSKFESEVNKRRTNLQAAMDFFGALCGGVGKGFEKLEPARKFLDSVAGVLGEAKAQEDKFQIRIGDSQDRKKLEPPKRPAPRPTAEIDDDIPF